MKQIFKKIYVVPALGAILLGSCAKKIDEAYTNPNATVRVPVESLLPNIISNMTISYTAQGTNYGPQNDGIHIGRYVNYWANATSLYQYDRMSGATGASDLFGSIWAMHYYGMGQNLNRMVEWGIEEQKWDYVGVGKAIRAWSWLMLTDTYGEAILDDAFNTSLLTFNYNTQEEIYEEVKRTAHEALSYLDRTDGNVSPANLAIGDAWGNEGDVEKWKKFAYAVLARVFNRYTNKASYQPDSVIHYANLAMKTNDMNTAVTWSNAGGTGTYSYFAPFRGNIGALRQTKFVADLMSGLNPTLATDEVDPRAYYIIRENPAGDFTGIRLTKGLDGLTDATGPANFWGNVFTNSTAPGNDDNARYIFTNGPEWPIATAAEMAFLRAEAHHRKGEKGNARTAYIEGINLFFDQLISDYEDHVPVPFRITPATRASYLADPDVVPAQDDLTLSHIMLQKYIALYGWGMFETWVDLRRYHYTDIDPQTGQQVYRDFVPPTGSELWPDNNGKLAYRSRPRYNSEYLYNRDELERIGALALDYHTKEPWFAQP